MLQSTLDGLKERFTAPLFGYIAFVWLCLNWKPILIIALGNNNIISRIQMAEAHLGYVNSFWGPLAIGLFTYIAIPRVNNCIEKLQLKTVKEIEDIKARKSTFAPSRLKKHEWNMARHDERILKLKIENKKSELSNLNIESERLKESIDTANEVIEDRIDAIKRHEKRLKDLSVFHESKEELALRIINLKEEINERNNAIKNFKSIINKAGNSYESLIKDLRDAEENKTHGDSYEYELISKYNNALVTALDIIPDFK